MKKKPVTHNKKKNFNKKRVDFRKEIDLKTHFKKREVGVKNGVFTFVSNLSIQDFSKSLNKSSAEIIKYLFLKGINCNLNTILNEEQMGELCLEFGYDFKKEIQIDEDNFLDNLLIEDSESTLTKRPPIITIMGHVDHGKTTLLDTIRKTKTANYEAGNITQKIGAYQVKWKDHLISFFDTPGHEAFSKMRAMGADLTDIVVIVIAADDGLKPQTEEAIDHALFAKVPIIIFINKIDKYHGSFDKIYTELSKKNILVEEWGGKVPVIKGSALKNIGIDDLLEHIVLSAELLDLKANKNRVANGITIEATLDKKKGLSADLLIQNGTLVLNDYILIGDHYGKIKKMLDFNHNEIKKASPSTPIRVYGLNGLPNAGDKWIVIRDKNALKKLVEKKQSNIKRKQINEANQLNQLNNSNLDKNEHTKIINIILKTDTHGSLEAILPLIKAINIEDVKLNIIRSGIGAVSETDINFAKTAKGYIITFNLKASSQINEYALANNITIRNYDVIYEIKDSIERLSKNLLDPVFVEKEIGRLEVKQLWTHSKIGTIVGCKVISGKVKRGCFIRIMRNNEMVAEKLKINSLKEFKENVNVVNAGKECGLTLENFHKLNVNDLLIAYEFVEEKYE